jgi:hypothetical protein
VLGAMMPLLLLIGRALALLVLSRDRHVGMILAHLVCPAVHVVCRRARQRELTLPVKLTSRLISV